MAEVIEYLGDIPHGRKSDRAEGIRLVNEARSILVVYDSPVEGRLILDQQEVIAGVYADIFPL